MIPFIEPILVRISYSMYLNKRDSPVAIELASMGEIEPSEEHFISEGNNVNSPHPDSITSLNKSALRPTRAPPIKLTKNKNCIVISLVIGYILISVSFYAFAPLSIRQLTLSHITRLLNSLLQNSEAKSPHLWCIDRLALADLNSETQNSTTYSIQFNRISNTTVHIFLNLMPSLQMIQGNWGDMIIWLHRIMQAIVDQIKPKINKYLSYTIKANDVKATFMLNKNCFGPDELLARLSLLNLKELLLDSRTVHIFFSCLSSSGK